MKPGRWILGLSFAVCWSAANAQSDSADRIWLAPRPPTASQSRWYPQPITTRSGKIIGLDDKQLQILFSGDEAETLIAARRVLWFEPADRSDKATEALRLFADRKYDQSLRPLLDVLGQRPPVWRQQWISMLASQAAWRSGRGAVALELVTQLDKRPLPPITIAYLPIAWSGKPGRGESFSQASLDAAANQLDSDSAAVRLVAASWLLSGSTRSSAVATLKQLAVGNGRPVIARLAETLLWRVATPPQVAQSAQQWLDKVDALPMVLQVGPTLTLIDKLRSAGQNTMADRLALSLQQTPPFPHPDLGK